MIRTHRRPLLLAAAALLLAVAGGSLATTGVPALAAMLAFDGNAKRAFQQTLHFDFPAVQAAYPGLTQTASLPVPAGKRLVIEYLGGAEGLTDTQGLIGGQFQLLTTVGGVQSLYAMTVGGSLVRIYADGGTTVVVKDHWDGNPALPYHAVVSLSGYLVDLPSAHRLPILVLFDQLRSSPPILRQLIHSQAQERIKLLLRRRETLHVGALTLSLPRLFVALPLLGSSALLADDPGHELARPRRVLLHRSQHGQLVDAAPHPLPVSLELAGLVPIHLRTALGQRDVAAMDADYLIKPVSDGSAVLGRKLIQPVSPAFLVGHPHLLLFVQFALCVSTLLC